MESRLIYIQQLSLKANRLEEAVNSRNPHQISWTVNPEAFPLPLEWDRFQYKNVPTKTASILRARSTQHVRQHAKKRTTNSFELKNILGIDFKCCVD